MKKLLFSAMAILLIVGTAYATKNSVEKEKKAIMEAIKEQTKASSNRDMPGLSSYWVHDESIVRIASGKNNYNVRRGWKEIGKGYETGIKNNPEPFKIRKEYSNVKIKLYKNSAWAVFNENSYNSEGKLTNEQIGTRFLEKEDGKWKIVYMSFINMTSYKNQAN